MSDYHTDLLCGRKQSPDPLVWYGLQCTYITIARDDLDTSDERPKCPECGGPVMVDTAARWHRAMRDTDNRRPGWQAFVEGLRETCRGRGVTLHAAWSLERAAGAEQAPQRAVLEEAEVAAQRAASLIDKATPDGWSFALWLVSNGAGGHATYVSNVDRAAIRSMVEEWLERYRDPSAPDFQTDHACWCCSSTSGTLLLIGRADGPRQVVVCDECLPLTSPVS